MFHKAGQRHLERLRKRGHRPGAAGERCNYASARRVGKRREHRIEPPIHILNHMV